MIDGSSIYTYNTYHGAQVIDGIVEHTYYNIKTFDFSILYTTIPHTLLKSRIKELLQGCFSEKNGKQRYLCFVIGRDKI